MNHNEQEAYTVSGKSFTAAAVSIASKAGEYVKSQLGQSFEWKLKSNPHDLVTEVDKGAEALIRKLIRTYFPAHHVLGEEGVEAGEAGLKQAFEEIKDKEYVWIVDPIDGTSNFVHGLPLFTISIALTHRGEVIVGVVYDPARDELFVAEKGKGAYVHGRKMSVSNDATLNDSLLATGFAPEREQSLPGILDNLSRIVPKVRNVRVLGSAALQLAYVAAGRFSGCWHVRLNAWDVAAGVLLVQEAGGRVTDIEGNTYELEARSVVATNGRIHDELMADLIAK